MYPQGMAFDCRGKVVSRWKGNDRVRKLTSREFITTFIKVTIVVASDHDEVVCVADGFHSVIIYLDEQDNVVGYAGLEPHSVLQEPEVRASSSGDGDPERTPLFRSRRYRSGQKWKSLFTETGDGEFRVTK